MINPQTQSEEASVRTQTVTTVTTDEDTLLQQGFSEDEITSLLWLRQWYQRGGSDRIVIVRNLEFVKHLIVSGRIEA
jgi:hypothetical protein